MSSADFFFNIRVLQINIFQKYHQIIKHFSRSGPMFCRPDLGQKCLLSADDTSRVRVYEENRSKLGSRLDRANHGSILNLKITNWENTPNLKLNVVEFFLNAKKTPYFDPTT